MRLASVITKISRNFCLAVYDSLTGKIVSKHAGHVSFNIVCYFLSLGKTLIRVCGYINTQIIYSCVLTCGEWEKRTGVGL